MTITVELSREQAEALLKFLREAPRADVVTEDVTSLVRVALCRALGR